MIGDGTTIGTRAVIVKDVPSYTIVRGVLAKPMRKRFSDDVISELLNLNGGIGLKTGLRKTLRRFNQVELRIWNNL